MADEQVIQPKTELLEQLSHLHITEPQPIRLICEGCEYILFHPTQQPPEAEEEDQTILLTEPEYKELYFAPLQQLIQALHHIFPNLHNQHKNELVLNFTTLEIRVPEDNIYSKELSLYDIDRLHMGANLPDRLLISLENQPRLAHRFNILATFVSQLDHPQEQEEQEGETEQELLTVDQQDLQFQDEPDNDSQEAFTTQDDPPLTSPNNLTAHQNPELILTTSTTTHLRLETPTPIIQPPSSEKDEQSATTTIITTATSLPLVSPPDHCSSHSSSSLLLPPVAPLAPENDEPELVGDDLEAHPDADDLEGGQLENIAATVDDYLPPEVIEAVEADQPEYDFEPAVAGHELGLNTSAAVSEAELEVPLNDATATSEPEEFDTENDLADSALEPIDEENYVRDTDQADRTGSLQPAAGGDDPQAISESQPTPDQLVPQSTETLNPPFDQANLILTSNGVIACCQSPAEELTHYQDSLSSEFPPHYEPDENQETNDQVAIESESNLDLAANASFPQSSLEEYVEENCPDFEASCSQSDLTLNGFEHVSEGQVEEQANIVPDDTWIHLDPENYDIELLSCPPGVAAADDDDDDDDSALKTATSGDYQLSNGPETTLVSISRPVPQLASKRNHTEVEHDLELNPISRSLIGYPDYLLDVKKTRTV